VIHGLYTMQGAIQVLSVFFYMQLSSSASSLSRFGNELWFGNTAGRVGLMDASTGRYRLVQVH